MLNGLVLGETRPSPESEASSLPPASTKKPLKDGEGEKAGSRKEVEKTVDRNREMREALIDFVIRVARNEDGRNTDAEVAAMPQVAALVYRPGRGAETWKS